MGIAVGSGGGGEGRGGGIMLQFPAQLRNTSDRGGGVQ